MHINSISHNVNFKRAFEIQEDSRSFSKKHSINDKNTPANQITRIMQGAPLEDYDSETRAKIINFFKSQITDYKPQYQNQIVVGKVINGHYYIFTGKDAIMARNTSNKMQKKLNGLRKKYTYEKGGKEHTDINYKKEKKKIYAEYDKKEAPSLSTSAPFFPDPKTRRQETSNQGKSGEGAPGRELLMHPQQEQTALTACHELVNVCSTYAENRSGCVILS